MPLAAKIERMIFSASEDADAARRAPWQEPLTWAATAIALSPTLVELARHLLEQAWTRYSLTFAALIAWRALQVRGERERRGPGAALVVGALAVQIGGLLASHPPIGRLALPLAVAGLLAMHGRAAGPALLLPVFLVPLPRSAAWTMGAAETMHAVLDAALEPLALAGATIAHSGSSVSVDDATLSLTPGYAGGLACVQGIGFALALSIGRGFSAMRTAGAVCAALLVAAPLQLVLLLGAVRLLAAGHAGIAQGLLDYAFPVVGLTLCLRFGRPARFTSEGSAAADGR